MPSTSGASWRLIVSTSGSSGIVSAYEVAARQPLGAAAGEMAQHARADIGERPVMPMAGPGASGLRALLHLPGQRQQRRVLAGVVGAGVRRVDPMVGSHDQQVPAAQA